MTPKAVKTTVPGAQNGVTNEKTEMNFANAVTVLRIIFSAALIFCPALSTPFYIFYTAAGISDMIDGPVARKTGKVSELGAKLDSAADLLFFAVCLIKLLPVMDIPVWIYVWAGAVALIKVVNLISGLVMYKKPVVLHTTPGRAAGVLLFIIPFVLPFINVVYLIITCAVATFAAVREGHLIRTGKAL